MDSIRPEELLPLAEYERVRAERRAAVVRLRQLRRVEIGPWVSVVFENRDAVLYQIQEMLLIERISERKAIEHEIETYAELLPSAGELSGTFFIEISDPAQRAAALPELLGIEKGVRLKVGAHAEAAVDKRPIDERFARPQAACVYYLRFPLSAPALESLRAGREPVWLEIDHPRYSHAARLRPEQVRALAADAS